MEDETIAQTTTTEEVTTTAEVTEVTGETAEPINTEL